jgi:hypothetical protein
MTGVSFDNGRCGRVEEPEVTRNERTARPAQRAVIVLVAAIFLLATALPNGSPAAEVSPITAFLLKRGAIGGIVPGNARIFRSVLAVRSAYGERPAKHEVRRYETEGLLEAATVRIHDKVERAAKGFSSVFEFQTTAGAMAEMEAEVNAEVDPEVLHTVGGQYLTLKHFSVPGVPEVVSVAFVTNNAAAQLGVESGTAKGLFVEGSCLLAVGIFRPASKDVIEPVISGVQAISERSDGMCP